MVQYKSSTPNPHPYSQNTSAAAYTARHRWTTSSLFASNLSRPNSGGMHEGMATKQVAPFQAIRSLGLDLEEGGGASKSP